MENFTFEFSIVDFLYSCNDENLNTSHVTSVRWQTTTPNSALATATVLFIYMVIGIPSNLLIIVSILWKKLYRQPTHILLLNLAINDLLMCCTYILINCVSAVSGEFIFGSNDITRCQVCKTGVIFVIFAHFNLYVLALLSLDRFLFIRLPFKYNRIVNIKTTLLTVICTWILCTLISIPPLFGFGEIRFTSIISTCSLYFLDQTNLTRNIYYEVFSIVQSFALPIPVLAVTNIWVLCIVQKQFKKIYKKTQKLEENGNKDKYRAGIQQKLNKTKNKKQLRLVKIYGAILIANLVTWMPSVINTIGIFVAIYRQVIIPNGFFVTNYLFFLSQVVIHPLLQAWLIPDIRKLFTNLCTKCLGKKTDPFANSSSQYMCCRWCELLGASLLPREGTTFRLDSISFRKHDTVVSISVTSPSQDKKLASPV